MKNNPKYPDYKNQNSLNDAWMKISQELKGEIPVVILKKKKEPLRSTYRTLI